MGYTSLQTDSSRCEIEPPSDFLFTEKGGCGHDYGYPALSRLDAHP